MGRAKKVQIDENILFMRSNGKPQKSDGLMSSRGQARLRSNREDPQDRAGATPLGTELQSGHSSEFLGVSSGIGGYNEDGFWDYLAGLFEGDGSIYGKEGRKPGFQITFNKKDLPLVKELATKLGGKINLKKAPNACDLVISDKNSLRKIAMEFNNRMRTPKRWRLNILIDWLNNKEGGNIEKKPMKTGGMGEDGWLAGFIDADGSFYVGYTKIREVEGGLGGKKRRIRNKLTIEQRMEDGRGVGNYEGVMREIAEFIGVNLLIRKQKESGREYYRVAGPNINNIEIIMKYLDKYRLLTSKYMDYRDWRIVAELIMEGKHYTEEGLAKVEEVRGRMNRKREEYNWDHLKGLEKIIDKDKSSQEEEVPWV